MLEFTQTSHQQSMENHPQLFNILLKSTKNDPRSMKMRPWNVFGAKLRPGRLQDAKGSSLQSTLGAFLIENGVPRDHVGAHQEPNIC